MTRHLPPPWRADKFSGGYVVRDANGFAVAYVYGRSTEAEAMEAKQMTMDEARRVASNIAKLPEMLKPGNSNCRQIARRNRVSVWISPSRRPAGAQ
jgi:hypothetical protein